MNEIDRYMSQKPIIPIAKAENYASAKWQYEYIYRQIKEFERTLDNEHEAALCLTDFGKSIVLNVTQIGYQDPCLIFYYGTVNGQKCQLIQHINQISFLLMAVDKEQPQEPPHRVIGFAQPKE